MEFKMVDVKGKMYGTMPTDDNQNIKIDGL